MQGVRLEVDTHIVTASTPNLRLLETATEKASLGMKHRTVSSPWHQQRQYCRVNKEKLERQL
jgi:hypothetical protein